MKARRASAACALLALAQAIIACSSSSSDATNGAAAAPASGSDAAFDGGAIADSGTSNDAGRAPVVDAGPDGGCFVATVGVFGVCLTTSDCASLGDHTSTPGYCPGAADIECCSRSPNVADNPAVPVGWKLMAQADVTADMTTWAVMILNDPTAYPMFSTTTRTFGALLVLARVEWHPPDFQNAAIHRGVTLYEPTD